MRAHPRTGSPKKRSLGTFIHELVVDPEYRGQGIATNLCQAVQAGFFAMHHSANSLYACIHAEEKGGRESFMNAGFIEIATYDDKMRSRRTMILKATRPGHVQVSSSL